MIKFSFKFSEPIRFPFYVNDFVYYWGVGSVVEASDAEMQLRSDAVLPYTKDVYTGELHEKIGIVGLNSFGHITLGDLDPHIIGDIDAMLSTLRVFGSIPASLVKEIKITQNNTLCNNITGFV